MTVFLWKYDLREDLYKAIKSVLFLICIQILQFSFGGQAKLFTPSSPSIHQKPFTNKWFNWKNQLLLCEKFGFGINFPTNCTDSLMYLYQSNNPLQEKKYFIFKSSYGNFTYPAKPCFASKCVGNLVLYKKYLEMSESLRTERRISLDTRLEFSFFL